jgi:plastocyanin
VRKSTPLHALVTGIIAVCIALPHAAWAADASDVEEVRREVRQLQAQVQALRAAISELAELDRQRAAALSRALKALPGSSEAAAAPSPRSEPVAPAPRPAPPVARAEPAPSAVHRAAPAPVESAVGAVKGKIDVPAGEPVAYVYVENILAPAVKGERKVIAQSGKKFVPGWAVIQRGTSIAFPNQDNIYHNVFSLSSGNSFDLGLYNAGGDPKSHTFTEAGPVDIYCNIHPQMAASVLVVPNRYYAKVKPDGSFEINGVPVGRRRVVAWSPGSRVAADWVEVAAGKSSDLNLKLDAKASAHKNKTGQSYGSYE